MNLENISKKYSTHLLTAWGHAVAQLVKHFATSREVAGSIPDG